MLDLDLAEMYGTETKRLKEAVRRNTKRFPHDFMFELTREEYNSLRSQFASSNTRGGTRYMPFAFTEQGVAMLSSMLNSDVAIEINIRTRIKSNTRYRGNPTRWTAWKGHYLFTFRYGVLTGDNRKS